MGIVIAGKSTAVLMSLSQQLIILIIQKKAFISNQNKSGFVSPSLQFILLEGIKQSSASDVFSWDFHNEDASTAL